MVPVGDRIVLLRNDTGHYDLDCRQRCRTVLDEIRATMVDTPETATIGEIELAIEQHNPHHALRHLTDERAPFERQLLALRSTLDDPDLPASVIEQHIDRLHERLNDLDIRIEQAEADVTLWDWGQRIDQTLAAAHTRRSNHLAYAALTNMEPWIENLLRADASGGSTTNAMDVRLLIQDVAAYRELTQHTGSDPLGPEPTGTTHLETHRRLRDQFDTAAAVNGVEPTLE